MTKVIIYGQSDPIYGQSDEIYGQSDPKFMAKVIQIGSMKYMAKVIQNLWPKWSLHQF